MILPSRSGHPVSRADEKSVWLIAPGNAPRRAFERAEKRDRHLADAQVGRDSDALYGQSKSIYLLDLSLVLSVGCKEYLAQDLSRERVGNQLLADECSMVGAMLDDPHAADWWARTARSTYPFKEGLMANRAAS
jgi:hypothetical protein